MKPKTFKLTKEEQEIEDNAHLFVPVSAEERARMHKAIELHNTQKKDKSISLRVSQGDLDGVKSIAVKEGMPYQTLISSIIHKYVTRQFVDKNDVKEITSLMK